MKQSPPSLRTLCLTLLLSFSAPLTFGQTPPPFPTRPINLPDLSADGAEYLSLADQTRIRFQIFASFADNIGTESGMALLSDPILQAAAQSFTTDILTRLAPNHHAVPYLLANPEYGASAFVGGVVITQQGLWAQSEQLSAFAAVLAHEWVHINNQHISRMLAAQAPSQWLGLLAGLAGLAAAGSNAQLGQALIYSSAAIPARQSLAFSRSMEEEADREGMNILERAGFSPQGMVESMETLTRYRGVSGESLAFLQTHPLSEERLASARRRAFQHLGQGSQSHTGASVAAPQQRRFSELQMEFDWLRYFITAPDRRAQQQTSLMLRYGKRAWFAPLMSLANDADASRTAAENTALRQTLLHALTADPELTPILMATFALRFNAKTPNALTPSENWSSRYWQAARARFPDSSLIAQLAAAAAWQPLEAKNSPAARALAQQWIAVYLAHPTWETPMDQPSAWNELLVSWFQTTEQSLGESYYLARSSLIRGNWALAQQTLERCEKILATLQHDDPAQPMLQALPNLNERLQSMKSLLRILYDAKNNQK